MSDLMSDRAIESLFNGLKQYRFKASENTTSNLEWTLVKALKAERELTKNLNDSLKGCNENNREFAKRFREDQDRIAKLESEVKRLREENERISQRLPSTTMQTVCEIQRAQIEKLKTAVGKLGGDPLEAIGDKGE